MSTYTDARDNNWSNRFSNPVSSKKAEEPGIPINKPGQPAQGLDPNNPKPEKPEGPAHEKTNLFKNWKSLEERDPTFKSMNMQMTDLAAKLRDKVRRGVMPMALAEKRLKEAMSDFQHNAGIDKDIQKQMQGEGLPSDIPAGPELQAEPDPANIPPEGPQVEPEKGTVIPNKEEGM